MEIISVSLDRDNQKQRWIDAIKKDELNWYNVSNLKFWNDPVAKMYNINSIPATFILDEPEVVGSNSQIVESEMHFFFN